jgi:hydrophobe/amphiphile efflux-3 (HAE3) family protein
LRFFRRLGPRAPSDFFGRVARTATERPLATIAVVAALALVGVGLALQLEPSASTDSLVSRSSQAAQATRRFHEQFGDESIVVLVKGPLERSVLTSDLARLVALEGCLSGNVPKDRPEVIKALPPPCQQIARKKPVKVVYGPGTFVNTAADQITKGYLAKQRAAQIEAKNASDAARALAKKKGYSKAQQDRFAKDAQQLAYGKFQGELVQLGLRYGLTKLPSLDNVSFVSQLVFDGTRGVYQPKARFAYLFPSPKAALILIRLKPDLSDSQRKDAIGLIRSAVAQPVFKLENKQRYIVSGVPVVVDSLASEVQRSIFVLLGAALLVMAATLMLVFRTRARLRLLPLALALAAAAMTYGSVFLAGHELTMASIAALPVLIGLAVDYAIQLHARFDEGRAEGLDPKAAARGAAARGAPTIAGAALATAAGFLVLLLSPVPMIHGFALLVILGIALALACALTAGLATLSRYSEPAAKPPDLPPLLPRTRARAGSLRERMAGGRLDSSRAAGALAALCLVVLGVAAGVNDVLVWAIAAAILLALAGLLALIPRGRRQLAAAARRRGRRSLGYAVGQPRRVLAVGLAIAVIGWVADTQTAVESDVRQLVPQDLAALRDVNELEAATGVSGEIDVTVRGAVTTPAAIKWMTDFQQRVLTAHGFHTGDTCLKKPNPPELCPALSLTDLFRQTPDAAANVNALLAAVPPYFSQAVISPDRRTATMAFGIRFMPLDRQQAVIDDIRRQMNPPPGIKADLAGLPVLAAEANGKLASDWRRFVTLLAALAAVFLVLLALRRRLSGAAIPLIPIALATGWSALVLFLLRIPLNPMSATLGALVIAISTEFSVLLSARYRQERDGGAGTERALELAYRSTGAAVLASGATAIAGFAAVIASDIRMLHDFGAVTVIDLTVSLLGVMLVLPAAIVWAEQHGRFTVADLDPRPLARAAWGGVRSVPGAMARIRPPRPRVPGIRRGRA